MNSLKVNMVIASILVAGITFMITKFIAEAVISPVELAKPAFMVAEKTGPATAAAKPAGVPDIIPLLAKANVKKGEQFVSDVCAACHNYTKGGGAKIGPDLYDVVDRPRASVKGFNYSDAIKKLGGKWTYHNLNLWLHDPQAVAPGTRMTYAGIADTQTRADVIAFLRTLSPNPVPLPTVSPAAAKPAAAEAVAAKPALPPSFAALIDKANVNQGKQFVSEVCAACHNYTHGAGAKIGPDLYDVVGRERHSVKGFDYSSAIKKLGGTWTYANLDDWLTDPAKVAPGTRMTFPGIPQAPLRADVIAFLRTLSPHPVPLPAASPAAAQPPAAKPAAAQAAAPAAAKPALPPSFVALLDKANVNQGKQFVSEVCAACHNDTPGAGAKIGPDLYDVVGRARASVKGFDYSSAIKKLGGTWTFANLDDWLTDPAKVAPGTRMTFPGIPQAPLRADVIAYLRTLSPHPEPLPAAPEASKAAGSKP